MVIGAVLDPPLKVIVPDPEKERPFKDKPAGIAVIVLPPGIVTVLLPLGGGPDGVQLPAVVHFPSPA
jgi:hypothetical protein